MDLQTINDKFEDIKDDMKKANYKYMHMFPVVAAAYITRDWDDVPFWVIAIGPPGSGKALDVDTPIPTPRGWKRNGDLETGDLVFDINGNPCRIKKAHPILLDRECYKITFSDGSTMVADKDHLWETKAREGSPWRKYSVKTTKKIKDTLYSQEDRAQHRIRENKAVSYSYKSLPISPYTLGVWLGDGNSYDAGVSHTEQTIIDLLSKSGTWCGEPTTGESCDRSTMGSYNPTIGKGGDSNKPCLKKELGKLDLIDNKHIPIAYLQASINQRIALLQGLMDTDGHVTANGACEFTTVIEPLADEVMELCCSLGLEPTCSEGISQYDGKECGPKFRIHFRAKDSINPFKLPRKKEKVRMREDCSLTYLRTITDIEPVESRPVRCITVDSEDGLYLAGKNMIPTHNTQSGSLFEQLEDFVVLGNITPAGLVTAYDCKGEDPSLFGKLEGGKMLFAPDFSSIMALRHEEKAEIFKYFRMAFDGYVDKKFANRHREYEPKFNMVAAATEAADQQRTMNQQLGERFIRYRMKPPDLGWPIPNVDPRLKSQVKLWMNELEAMKDYPDTGNERWIGTIGDTTARLRTEVTHKGRTSEILHVNEFERPIRLCKQFSKMYRGLMCVTGDKEYSIDLVKRGAVRCIPDRRIKILQLLAKEPDLNTSRICEKLSLGRRVVDELVGDMCAMGMLRKEKKWERPDESFQREYGIWVTDEYIRRGQDFFIDEDKIDKHYFMTQSKGQDVTEEN